MPRCPRCDSKTDQLHPIPREAVAETATPRSAEEAATAGKACRWCIHEITEG